MNQDQPCEYLNWDSDFFGFRIARVEGHTLDTARLEEINAWCSQHEIELLYFLADSNHFETTRLAEQDGFHQVDIRMTLQRDLTEWSSERSRTTNSPSIMTRAADQQDLQSLIPIASTSYGLSRFYFDPCFPEEASAALYQEWIRKSIQGYADLVLVAEVDRAAIGYATANLPPSGSDSDHPGEIGLVGVAAAARGQGVASLLTYRILDWYYQNGVKYVNVVTQGRNIAAQRLYQRVGFLTHSIQLWYHKWLVDCQIVHENE